jgi:dethiobiotin synthetase
MGRILFITGTGTGVGKTVLTALLLRYLREEGHQALAMKPFCSGSRADARLLQRLQAADLSLPETNPFLFRHPLAPWVAAKKSGSPQIPLRHALAAIRRLSKRCKILLVEGCGGVLAPLGDNYAAADLISRLGCQTVIVAPNCLGTINHTLMTTKYMQVIGAKDIKVVMMSVEKPDSSSRSNMGAIRELLPGISIFSLPHLGRDASKLASVKINVKKMKKMLAQLFGGVIVRPFLPSGSPVRTTKSVDKPALKR